MSELNAKIATACMQELFPEETARALAQLEAAREAEAKRPKPRGVYHDRNGKFTDRTTAEIASLEKERDLYKKNYQFFKRVNKRLSEEIKSSLTAMKEMKQRLEQYERQAEQNQSLMPQSHNSEQNILAN